MRLGGNREWARPPTPPKELVNVRKVLGGLTVGSNPSVYMRDHQGTWRKCACPVLHFSKKHQKPGCQARDGSDYAMDADLIISTQRHVWVISSLC